MNSPCIDAGCASSDYSKEPEDNGNRINIGRYGNTIYASLSSTSGVKTIQPSLMDSIPEATNETGENLSFTAEVFDSDEDNFTYSEDPSTNFEQDLVIESIPEATVKIGENLNFTVKASDVNGGNLTFSASDLPAGASFDETGIFCWTPSDGQEGLYTISFEVSDGMFNDSEVAIISVVEEAPSNLSDKMYDSYFYEVSPEGLNLNNLSFVLEE